MESDCVLYDGFIGDRGYGLDYDPSTKKTISAHRLAFREHFGYLPEVVMHICDTPACVNPYHLKGGTQKENILDCISKGRYVYAKRKLTKREVLCIYGSDQSQRKLAALFNVDQKTIWNIKNGICYKQWTGHGGSCGV